MFKFTSLLVIFAGLSASLALNLNRPCPSNINAKTGFEVPPYLGAWYELERYEAVDQPNGDCVTATYDINEDGSVRVENSMTTLNSGQILTLVGRAVLSFPDSDPLMAKLNVSFFGMPNDRSNYWALDTDYVNFAVVWQCEDLAPNQSRENYWLLSRTSQFPTDPAVLNRISAVTDNLIFREEVRTTVQESEACLRGVDPYVINADRKPDRIV